jgi:hypothetical protein
MSCSNCTIEINHKTVWQNILGVGDILNGDGHVDGSIDLDIDMTLTCKTGLAWKQAFKEAVSEPVIWGIPAYKKIEEIWAGSGPMCSDFALGATMGLSFVPFKGEITFGFQAQRTFSMPLSSSQDSSTQAEAGVSQSEWTFSINPVDFSGFGLPSLALGVDMSADWGWKLEDTPPLFDAGFDLHPKFTMNFLSREATLDDSGDYLQAQECELPFGATAGEQPTIYASALGKELFDTVLSIFQETWAFTDTAGCYGSITSAPAAPVAASVMATTTAISPDALRYGNSSVTYSSSSSMSLSITSTQNPTSLYPYPVPTAFPATSTVVQTITSLFGTEYNPSSLNALASTRPSLPTTATTSVAPLSVVASMLTSTSATVSTLNTIKGGMAAPTGVYNTDSSCGYGQGVHLI